MVVHVPASATANAASLRADGDQKKRRNQSARASIELDVNEALAKQLEGPAAGPVFTAYISTWNSARIQARSESAIRANRAPCFTCTPRGACAWKAIPIPTAVSPTISR